MKKKLLITLPVIALILIAVYLFAIPAMQTNSYKETVKSNQLALSSSADKAIGAASQNAFLSQDISLAEAKNALKISTDAISNFETKISSNEKGLTNLSELPFISAVNKNYKTAIDLKSLEEQYVTASKEYLAEFKSVNDYNKKTLPILEISEGFEAVSEKFQAAQSEAELTAAIDEYISKLEEAKMIATPIQPAESTKEMHDFSISGLGELSSIMKQLKAAIQAMDVEKMMTLSNTLQEKTTLINEKSKEITVRLIDESKLAKLGDRLNDLNKQIDAKIAEL